MITYFQKAIDDHIMDKINNVDFKEMEMHSKCRLQRSGHFVPTLTFQLHWHRNKLATILHTPFWNIFSWMQIVVFHSYFTEFIINGTKGPNEK